MSWCPMGFVPHQCLSPPSPQKCIHRANFPSLQSITDTYKCLPRFLLLSLRNDSKTEKQCIFRQYFLFIGNFGDIYNQEENWKSCSNNNPEFKNPAVFHFLTEVKKLFNGLSDSVFTKSKPMRKPPMVLTGKVAQWFHFSEKEAENVLKDPSILIRPAPSHRKKRTNEFQKNSIFGQGILKH